MDSRDLDPPKWLLPAEDAIVLADGYDSYPLLRIMVLPVVRLQHLLFYAIAKEILGGKPAT